MRRAGRAKGLTVRVRGVRATLTLAAIAAVTLAGCNDEPPEAGTVDEPTQSATTEPTEEPTTEEPTDPETTESEPTEEPTDDSDDGGVVVDGSGDGPGPDVDAAQSFLEGYLDELDAAMGSGEVEALAEMTAASCETCTYSIDYIAGVYEDGGEIRGSQADNIDIDPRGGADGLYSFKTVSEITAYEVLDAQGEPTETGPAYTLTVNYAVQQSGGDWKVVGGAEVQ